MIKTELRNYFAEVKRAYDATLAKFNNGIKEGHILHILQWQTSSVAAAVHEWAKVQVLMVVVEQYEGAELVNKLRREHASLTHALIMNAKGQHSTNPIANEINQMETMATAQVLEKIDNILRFDSEVQHATSDAAQKALNVVALDPKIAKLLHKNDPKALEQVNAARTN